MLSVPLRLPAGDERHGDERLGLDGRPGHESDAWIEVRLVREHRLRCSTAQPVMPSPNPNVSLMTSVAHLLRARTGMSSRLASSAS